MLVLFSVYLSQSHFAPEVNPYTARKEKYMNVYLHINRYVLLRQTGLRLMGDLATTHMELITSRSIETNFSYYERVHDILSQTIREKYNRLTSAMGLWRTDLQKIMNNPEREWLDPSWKRSTYIAAMLNHCISGIWVDVERSGFGSERAWSENHNKEF